MTQRLLGFFCPLLTGTSNNLTGSLPKTAKVAAMRELQV